MIKDFLKGGDMMNKSKTAKNIVYLDYLSSSNETGCYETSSKPDSLISIMKDCFLVNDYNLDREIVEKQES